MGKIELELSNNKLQLQQSMMMRMGMEEEQKRALWLSAARPLPPHSIRISVTADQCSVTRPPPDVTGEMENAVPLPEKWWYIALEKRDKIWNFNISSMITRVEPLNIKCFWWPCSSQNLSLTDCVLTTSDFQSKIQILLCPDSLYLSIADGQYGRNQNQDLLSWSSPWQISYLRSDHKWHDTIMFLI